MIYDVFEYVFVHMNALPSEARSLDTLWVELPVVFKLSGVGVGNWTQFLWKGSKYCKVLNHISRLSDGHINRLLRSDTNPGESLTLVTNQTKLNGWWEK